MSEIKKLLERNDLTTDELVSTVLKLPWNDGNEESQVAFVQVFNRLPPELTVDINVYHPDINMFSDNDETNKLPNIYTESKVTCHKGCRNMDMEKTFVRSVNEYINYYSYLLSHLPDNISDKQRQHISDMIHLTKLSLLKEVKQVRANGLNTQSLKTITQYNINLMDKVMMKLISFCIL